MITTERQEVELPGLLISDALTFHAQRGYSNCESACGDIEPTSPVPNGEGPGAPSGLGGVVIETGATRQECCRRRRTRRWARRSPSRKTPRCNSCKGRQERELS